MEEKENIGLYNLKIIITRSSLCIWDDKLTQTLLLNYKSCNKIHQSKKKKERKENCLVF